MHRAALVPLLLAFMIAGGPLYIEQAAADPSGADLYPIPEALTLDNRSDRDTGYTLSGSFLDDRLEINLTGYLGMYRNHTAVPLKAGERPARFNGPLPQEEPQGIEAEVLWYLTPGLTVTGSMGILDSKRSGPAPGRAVFARRIDSLNGLNTRIGLQSDNRSWEIHAWGHNLAGEESYRGVEDLFRTDPWVPAPGRAYGLEAVYHF